MRAGKKKINLIDIPESLRGLFFLTVIRMVQAEVSRKWALVFLHEEIGNCSEFVQDRQRIPYEGQNPAFEALKSA